MSDDDSTPPQGLSFDEDTGVHLAADPHSLTPEQKRRVRRRLEVYGYVDRRISALTTRLLIGAALLLLLPGIGVLVMIGEYRERISTLQSSAAETRQSIAELNKKIDRLLFRGRDQ